MEDIDLTKYEGHTPGPWKVTMDMAAMSAPHTMVVGQFDCMGQHKRIICTKTGGANARLIADAPTNLRKLKEAEKRVAELEKERDKLIKMVKTLDNLFEDCCPICYAKPDKECLPNCELNELLNWKGE